MAKVARNILECDTCKKIFDRREFDVGRKTCSIGCFFFSKVDENQPGCWLWPGRIDRNGYAVIRWRYKEYLAHRIGYALCNKKDTLIEHSIYNICGNRHCVRGDHWEEK